MLIELEFGVLTFVEGGQPENPEKNPRSEARTNSYSTYICYIGGRGALSPLRHN